MELQLHTCIVELCTICNCALYVNMYAMKIYTSIYFLTGKAYVHLVMQSRWWFIIIIIIIIYAIKLIIVNCDVNTINWNEKTGYWME